MPVGTLSGVLELVSGGGADRGRAADEGRSVGADAGAGAGADEGGGKATIRTREARTRVVEAFEEVFGCDVR